MKQLQIIIISIIFFPIKFIAQTADVTEGCAPLTVTFDAPDQVSYFWDFEDGASSVLKKPENVFTVPGSYLVTLYVSEGGQLIGDLLITVYPDVTVEITNDKKLGCIPLEVNFGSSVQNDPAVSIEKIEWTFGDGTKTTGAAPTHTYTYGGIFDISIEVITNLSKCNKTFIFEDVIEAQDLQVGFNIPSDPPCSEPSTFPISTNSNELPGYSYLWNFGNEITSEDFNPGDITFDKFGVYDIFLRIEAPNGCVDTSFTSVRIGPMEADVTYPESVCVGQEVEIINATLTNRYSWSFDDPRIQNFTRDALVTFTEPGLQTITLLTWDNLDCVNETIIEIDVEKPNPNFSSFPAEICSDKDPRFLKADDPNLTSYVWNGVEGDSEYTLPGLEEDRHPLHINVEESVLVNLEVTSSAGCVADTSIVFVKRLAEAYFIPSHRIGLNSLSLTFTDESESKHEIVRRHWIYGDTNEAELDPSITEHEYQYTCGEYYPRLVIEDANGCIDTSKQVRIRVVCPDTLQLQANPSQCSQVITDFCVPADVQFLLTNNGFENHIFTDNGRISHCWPDLVVQHTYKFPGVFPVIARREFDGVLLDTFYNDEIEILGARSEALYEKDCTNPYSVNFQSNSVNADKLEWFYKGDKISEAATFTHTFDEPGEHLVILNATNVDSGCEPDRDAVTIFITELKADFELTTDPLCAGEFYTLDARSSEDVFASCSKGYKWIFEDQRPRETESATLEHIFKKGDQKLTLVVEDINGCTDTISKRIKVYGVEAKYNLDESACLPYDKDFIDLSTADTTIVSWEWSFGSNEQNPSYTFQESDLDSTKMDTITIQLISYDILGCKDTIEQELTILDPEFEIDVLGRNRVCVGENLNFYVKDTAGIKEYYNFYWEIDGVRTAEGYDAILVFKEEGEHVVTLVSDLINGVCIRETEKTITALGAPEVGFTSDVDDLNIICYPAQISFTSDPSISPFNHLFSWKFGNGDFSDLRNPAIEFGIGTHQVTQIITNTEGCMDSTSQFITLVGPEGHFEQDKDAICLGEPVTFMLKDTANVSEYYWNFGDGKESSNINPVTHIYEERPLGDSTIVTLTIFSNDTGCDLPIESPILIRDITAEIEDLGQVCRGQIRLANNSTGASSYVWDFGDGTNSTDEIPEKTYENADSYQIILTATDADGNCTVSDSITITVDEEAGAFLGMPNLFTPNNDNKNDVFGPEIEPGKEDQAEISVFKIYNRYGELVFDNNNPDGWKGFFKSENAPPEVYAYYIELEIEGCSTISEKGNVTLMR